MIDVKRAIDVLSDESNYMKYRGIQKSVIQLTYEAGKGIADLIEHLSAELDELRDCNRKCKVDCILKEYDKVREERDRLSAEFDDYKRASESMILTSGRERDTLDATARAAEGG